MYNIRLAEVAIQWYGIHSVKLNLCPSLSLPDYASIIQAEIIPVVTAAMQVQYRYVTSACKLLKSCSRDQM